MMHQELSEKNIALLQKDATYPKLTVITASFNSAQVLERCILSVLNQQYPNLEYIIVDGGSTDGTLDIIKKYDKDIACWISEPDTGIGDAWNKGLMKSTGEIIAIVDSDNSYEPGIFNMIVDNFTGNPSADFIHGNVRYWDENGMLYIKKPYLKEKYFWKFMPYLFPSCFIRRSLYEKYGLFNISYKLTMDYELLLRFFTKGVKFLYIDKVIANFQLGGVSDVRCESGLVENKDIIIDFGYNRAMAYFNLYRFILRRRTKRLLEHLHLDFVVNMARKTSRHWHFE